MMKATVVVHDGSSEDDPKRVHQDETVEVSTTTHNHSNNNNNDVERGGASTDLEETTSQEEGLGGSSQSSSTSCSQQKLKCKRSLLLYNHNNNNKPLMVQTGFLALLSLCLGIVAFSLVLGLQISKARTAEKQRFETTAKDMVEALERSLADYELAALWIHESCRRDRSPSHAQFSGTYEYIKSSGMDFEAAGFLMYVPRYERAMYEAETAAYVESNLTGVKYHGFMQAAPGSDTGTESLTLEPASNKSAFYYPIHFAEPLTDPWVATWLDFDMYSLHADTIDKALGLREPVLTPRAINGHSGGDSSSELSYIVNMMHPGVGAHSTKDLSTLRIQIPTLLQRALSNFTVTEGIDIHIYDVTDKRHSVPAVVGGASLYPSNNPGQPSNLTVTLVTELSDARIKAKRYTVEETVVVAWRDWLFFVAAHDGTYVPEWRFSAFGAAMIMVASFCLAAWLHTSAHKAAKMQKIRSKAEEEKAKMRLESARNAAVAERDLNDFIAHEVRNPIAAAMSACSFVSASVHERVPLVDEESRRAVREDVQVIDSSLKFVNDLLRNMLDIHRVASQRLVIEKSPVDVYQDILVPVRSMLYSRGAAFDVTVDCPQHLIVESDLMRLKQTVLNLGRNSSKFVERGHIRLGAAVEEGSVHIFVEDTGPGIPQKKRKHLFAKFQESLDSLNQGTGIGLSLCKSLVELLGGEIRLDETFDSGVEGCPGARFVIDLKTAPLQWEEDETEQQEEGDSSEVCAVLGEPEPGAPAERDQSALKHNEEQKQQDGGDETNKNKNNTREELPETLSVLFVDDAFVLRKLFTRSIKRACANWLIQEAASGEAALDLVESQHFDLIFMDQYMASVEKQLLGTETVRALRSKGIASVICGLSANDLEKQFLDAGANSFLMKPFPCEKEELRLELQRILRSALPPPPPSPKPI